jgi:hypothetical protein
MSTPQNSWSVITLVGAAEQRRGDIDAEGFSGANEPHD